MSESDDTALPPNLPAPSNDGAADHLPGLVLPPVRLATHAGGTLDLNRVSTGRWVLFIYPSTGVPGEDMPQGWDEIPGARGCTPEACGFRDQISALRDAGAHAVFGLSSHASEHQAELAARLHLPYPLLSDPNFVLGDALSLPTFEAEGTPYYKRLTLIARADKIEHAFYPVFPPDEHATNVLDWLHRLDG